MNCHNNNKAKRFHSELMDGENPGNERKGVSSIMGTFHGGPCLWFCFLLFFHVSVTLWRRGVWASYLRPTVPLGGEDKTAWPCCRCSPAPPGWWCVGDTWKDRRTELMARFSVPHL